MMNLWVWRIFVFVSVPSLAVLGISVSSQLPHAAAMKNEDFAGLMTSTGIVAGGVLLLLASAVLRYRGRPGMAAFLAGIVAMPALCLIGFFGLIVLLFILKGM